MKSSLPLRKITSHQKRVACATGVSLKVSVQHTIKLQNEIPEEMLLCLEEEPQALTFFNKLTESEQKFYIQYIYSAKKEETKIVRLAKTINKLVKGLKMYDKETSWIN